MSASYRVKPGIRVVVDGEAYSDGATFTAGEKQVADLLANGWVTEVGAKAIQADEVEDKAAPRRRRAPRKQG